MNTPIDPREGDRRQKALRARLAAMMSQSNKALVGKLGQQRGRVRSVGAVGGARGARIMQNGAARPGALNFLQGPGFGLGHGGPVGGPSMHAAQAAFAAPRRVSNPLPTMPLGNAPAGGPVGSLGSSYTPDPTPLPGLDRTITDPMDPSELPDVTSSSLPRQRPGGVGSVGLIPLGGGRYLDPSTGIIHGGALTPQPQSSTVAGAGHHVSI